MKRPSWSPLGLATALALTLAVAGGAATFHRALDPTRSEANGITLNLLADYGNGAVTNDWYSGQTGVEVRRSKARLEIRDAPVGGYQLVSRPLAVYPHRTYVARVRLRTDAHRSAGVAIADGDLTTYLAVRAVPATKAPVSVDVRFSSGSRQRVAIVLFGPPKATLELSSARLTPVG